MPPACTMNSSNPDSSWSRKSRSPLVYHDVKLECGYRVDLMVEKKLIIEIKSVECLNDIHLTQVLIYLKLANCKLGLLMNFNVLRLKEGIRRVVNSL
jgi:GxxExxY protein